MTFDEYQKKAFEVATYPLLGSNIVYPAMGASGEAGELSDKIKKHWRNTNAQIPDLKGLLTDQQKEEIIKEIGDVLWYLGALSTELGVSLDRVAQKNLDKLYDRHSRGVIKSEGDNR
jgi:NTP pyrophosphatase (non-canonical NTP hydrolase)